MRNAGSWHTLIFHYVTHSITMIQFWALVGFLFIIFFPASVFAQQTDTFVWLNQIQVPSNPTQPADNKITVAIVDDGVRTSHNDLRDFIWQNPYEIPGNFIDDDGNGKTDDINGWDVSDNNNSIMPPPGRLQEYYHGTHLAGIITRIAKTMYGNDASGSLAIMVVKALSDQATNTAIRHGYKGIEYALQAGADIILCAWNVGHISSDEERILDKAEEQGVLIISTAGNFPEERDMYPAAHDSVLAVTAVNSENIIPERSNYGTFVDISAPGVAIESASSASDTAYETRDGTSQAAAIVAGAAAVMKARNPDAPNKKIVACLKNTSTRLAPKSSEYAAKQGAGLLNLQAAVECMESPAPLQTSRKHPQGYLNLSAAKPGTTTWTIEPSGTFKGIWFTRPVLTGVAPQAAIDLYAQHTGTEKPFASFPIAKMPERFFVAGTRTVVTLTSQSGLQNTENLLMEYRAEAIQFRSLYCEDTVYFTEPGTFDDGSGPEPYSANSDCKWQITAPKGKVIHFKFTEFDTEPRTDLLYFFNGKGTHEKIMAVFSGPDIPPELYTWQNQVLVWFVTNGEKQGQGWKGEFTFVDSEKAIYPELPKAEK